MTGSVVSGDELTRVLAGIKDIVAALQPLKQPPPFDSLPASVAALPENDALLVRYRHGELTPEQASKLMVLAMHHADLPVMEHLTDGCGVAGPFPLNCLQWAIFKVGAAEGGVDRVRAIIQFVIHSHGHFQPEPDEVVAVMWAAAGVSTAMARMVVDELPVASPVVKAGSLAPYAGVLGDDFCRKLRLVYALDYHNTAELIACLEAKTQ